MGPVHRLSLDRWIPPRVEDVDVVRCGEVETLAARLQAHEEETAVNVFLEPLHASLPVGRLAIEVFVGDPTVVEATAHDRKKTGELAEHQHLVPLVDHLRQLFEERVELGGRLVEAGGIDEAGVAGRLTQPQQRLEHRDPRPPDAHAADPARQLQTVVLPQFVVGLSLFLAKFTEQCLLGLLGQIGEHLRLGAPQEVGSDGTGHHLGARAAARQKPLESCGAAELAGIEKLEDAPELADVVLHWRAREGQTMAGPQEAAGLGRLAGGILDRLRLVEHHVVELDLAVVDDVAA